MKDYYSASLAFLVFVFSSGYQQAVGQQDNAFGCDPEVAQACWEENRICVSSDEPSCGPCLEGFVELAVDGGVCVDIEDVTLEQFLALFEVFYRDDDSEGGLTKEERLELLKKALIFISIHNYVAAQRNNTDLDAYTLGVTPYSADSEMDYKARSGYFYVNVTGTQDELPRKFSLPSSSARQLQFPSQLPDRVDWVERGGVTSVKDQGRCGCCWAVSLSGAIEGAAFANNGYSQSVSFQQFISCNQRNDGCDGGNLIIAALYSYANDFEGIARLNDYEYTDWFGDETTTCSLDELETPRAVEITGGALVGGLDAPLTFEERLQEFKAALAEKPIAMAIKSACSTLSNYRKGVLTDDGDCACTVPDCLDHAVLMVGYDDTAEIPYFKLKNSWGTLWGEDGYFRIAQTPKGTYGLFGMLGEGVVIDAHNVTVQVYDEKQVSPLTKWWVIFLIVVAGLCCCCVTCAVFRKMREDKEKPEAR